MRQWTRWLVPAATLIVVCAAVVLPEQFSKLRDQAFLGQAQYEALPTASPGDSAGATLKQRLELYVRRKSADDQVFEAIQMLDQEELTGAKNLLQDCLVKLAQGGVLPEGMQHVLTEAPRGYRSLLSAPNEGLSARFLTFLYSDKSYQLTVVVDEVSGLACLLNIYADGVRPEKTLRPEQAGENFFRLLDLEAVPIAQDRHTVVFQVADSVNLRYTISLEEEFLDIAPTGLRQNTTAFIE